MRLTPWGRVSSPPKLGWWSFLGKFMAPGKLSDPHVLRSRARIQSPRGHHAAFGTASIPGARIQPGTCGDRERSRGEIYPSCSISKGKQQLSEEVGSSRAEGRKGPFSRALPGGSGGAGRQGVSPRAAGSVQMPARGGFFRAVRLISSRLPAQTPAVCYMTRHYIFATYGVHHHPQAITV